MLNSINLLFNVNQNSIRIKLICQQTVQHKWQQVIIKFEMNDYQTAID